MNKTATLLFPIFLASVLGFGQTEQAENYRLYKGDSLNGFDLNACFTEMNEYHSRVHLNEAEKQNFMRIREYAFIQNKYHLGGQVFDEMAWKAADVQNQKGMPVAGPKKLKLISGNAFSSNSPAAKIQSSVIPDNQGMAGCDNLDWEDNNVSNWTGSMGYTIAPSLQYYGLVPLSGPSSGPSKFVSAGAGGGNYFGPSDAAETSCSGVTLISKGTVPFGNFPMVGAGSFSARLGGQNVNLGHGFGTNCDMGDASSPYESAGEIVAQTMAVTVANCMITYNYNVVLADGGHSAGNQPFFQAGVLDNTGTDINCAVYYQECTTGVPPAGYSTSALKDPIDATAPVYYSNWQSNSFDLTPYIGTTVTLYFMVGGCVPGGHFGYAYIDGHCGPKVFPVVGPVACQGNTETITAPPMPPGTTYSWTGPGIVGSNSGSTVLVNTQGTYTVSTVLPAPNNTCPMAVSATVTFNPNPATFVSLSSTDPSCSACTDGSITATPSGGTSAFTYSWAPTPGAGQGAATASGLGIGQYTVTVIDANQCSASSTATLSFTTAIHDNSPTDFFKVFPNPASGFVTIEYIGLPAASSL